MATASSGPVVIVSGCSDPRLNLWFTEMIRVTQEMGGQAFPVRVPGGAAILTVPKMVRLFLQPVFRKGATLVVLQNHHNCAWVADFLRGTKARRLTWFFGLGNADALNEWVLRRATRAVDSYTTRAGWSTLARPVIVLSELVAPNVDQVSPDILQVLRDLSKRDG